MQHTSALSNFIITLKCVGHYLARHPTSEVLRPQLRPASCSARLGNAFTFLQTTALSVAAPGTPLLPGSSRQRSLHNGCFG
jgi:hypothetical protein